MLKIPATLPGLGEVTVVWFVATGKETLAVYVTSHGYLGEAPIEDFIAVLPPSKGLLLIGAEDE